MNTSLTLTRERTLQKRTDLQHKARIYIRQSKSARTLRAVALKTKRTTTNRILKQMLQTLPTDTLQGLREP